MPSPKPWSHSSLQQFETCGRQYEEVKVLHNFQDEKNPASLWGDEVHKAFESWLMKMGILCEQSSLDYDAALATLQLRGEGLPERMAQYAPYLKQFVVRPGQTWPERQYALSKRLTAVDFLSPDCWCRGIIDVLTLDGDVAWVDDHKTGKNRKKDMQQLIIFALLVFYHHPEIQTVHTAYHWLQMGLGEDATDRETFTRAQIPELWATLVPKLERYMKAFHLGIFHPKPSGLCKRYCVVKTCEYFGGGK